MKRLILVLYAFLFTLPAQGKTLPTSLFFTPPEVASIEHPPAPPPPAPASKTLTLTAILYFTPTSWTVWLDGEKWTPETTRPNLQILDVQPDHIRLSHLGKPVTLKLHESLTYSIPLDNSGPPDHK